jgi:hypothetical protein
MASAHIQIKAGASPYAGALLALIAQLQGVVHSAARLKNGQSRFFVQKNPQLPE